MGAFGRAIADVGKGLMERNARKREMEDLARIKAEEEQAAWDREAPKRELEKTLAEQRIAASKAAEEASRLSGETSKLNAVAGKVVGPDRFYAQEAVDEQGRTTFIPQREEVGLSAEAKLRSRDSNARTGAIQNAADVRRQDTIAERRRQEKLALQAEQRKLELAKTKALGGYSPSKNFDVTPEQYAERVASTYEEPLAAIKTQLESLDSGLMSEAADDFASSQEAASALGQDPNVRVTFKHPDGSVTDTGPGSAPPAGGPKTQANKVPATAESYESVYAEAYAQFKSMPGISDDVAKAEAEKIAAPYKKAK